MVTIIKMYFLQPMCSAGLYQGMALPTAVWSEHMSSHSSSTKLIDW